MTAFKGLFTALTSDAAVRSCNVDSIKDSNKSLSNNREEYLNCIYADQALYVAPLLAFSSSLDCFKYRCPSGQWLMDCYSQQGWQIPRLTKSLPWTCRRSRAPAVGLACSCRHGWCLHPVPCSRVAFPECLWHILSRMYNSPAYLESPWHNLK